MGWWGLHPMSGDTPHDVQDIFLQFICPCDVETCLRDEENYELCKECLEKTNAETFKIFFDKQPFLFQTSEYLYAIPYLFVEYEAFNVKAEVKDILKKYLKDAIFNQLTRHKRFYDIDQFQEYLLENLLGFNVPEESSLYWTYCFQVFLKHFDEIFAGNYNLNQNNQSGINEDNEIRELLIKFPKYTNDNWGIQLLNTYLSLKENRKLKTAKKFLKVLIAHGDVCAIIIDAIYNGKPFKRKEKVFSITKGYFESGISFSEYCFCCDKKDRGLFLKALVLNDFESAKQLVLKDGCTREELLEDNSSRGFVIQLIDDHFRKDKNSVTDMIKNEEEDWYIRILDLIDLVMDSYKNLKRFRLSYKHFAQIIDLLAFIVRTVVGNDLQFTFLASIDDHFVEESIYYSCIKSLCFSSYNKKQTLSLFIKNFMSKDKKMILLYNTYHEQIMWVDRDTKYEDLLSPSYFHCTNMDSLELDKEDNFFDFARNLFFYRALLNVSFSASDYLLEDWACYDFNFCTSDTIREIIVKDNIDKASFEYAIEDLEEAESICKTWIENEAWKIWDLSKEEKEEMQQTILCNIKKLKDMIKKAIENLER